MRALKIPATAPGIASRWTLLFFMTALALMIFAAETRAAPKADLWERWTAHDAGSSATIDHGAWDRFLKAYVEPRSKGANLVAYGKVAPADKHALAAYIEALEAVPISRYGRDEQLAYWINLYNALTVKVVLDHYPVKGIRDIDISPGWFADGPWDKKLAMIEGKEVSLNDIEHRILRPIWRDPRVHYAVNCASIGCPDLATEAVKAETADAYLTRGARAYVNDARGVEVRDGRIYVSSIYSWFEEDFDADGGVLPHIRKYAEDRLAGEIDRIGKISGDDYDWTLNDAARSDGS